jgi:DHA1 family multidrug resistance protein-like MFS transporter
MSDLIREAALGQVIRLFTNNKSLRYPEEDPNFKIPWEEAAVNEKEKKLDADGDLTPPAANNDPEQANVSRTISLAMIPTAASSGRLQATASRIMSREQTLPYSTERFQVEREEQSMRATSTIIQPQKTADGVTLVDWYTSESPEDVHPINLHVFQSRLGGVQFLELCLIWFAYSSAPIIGELLMSPSTMFERDVRHLLTKGNS